MRHRGRFASTIFLLGALSCAQSAVGGLDPESNTDGFDPAAQSYRINEARRLNAISRQLDLTYRMQRENPYFPGEPPIRQPIGYESKQVGANRWIYRPIYAEDVNRDSATVPESLPPPAAGKTPAEKPQRPAPAGAAPEDFIPPKDAPKKPAGPGPREF